MIERSCVKVGNAHKSMLKQSKITHKFLERTIEQKITHILSTPSHV